MQGVKLELCTDNRVGFLSDITRVLRENSFVIVRADVKTHEEKTMSVFYIRDISGKEVDIEYFSNSLKKEMGPTVNFQVKHETSKRKTTISTEKSHRSFESRIRYRIERLSRLMT